MSYDPHESKYVAASLKRTYKRKNIFFYFLSVLFFLYIQQRGAALRVKQMVESLRIIDLNINCSTCWELVDVTQQSRGGSDLLSHRLPPSAPHTAPQIILF